MFSDGCVMVVAQKRSQLIDHDSFSCCLATSVDITIQMTPLTAASSLLLECRYCNFPPPGLDSGQPVFPEFLHKCLH